MKKPDKYEQLRLDFNRQSTKSELKEKLGCKCANCGSSIDVEYHHIVPLALGGTNKITNIVPLCFVCHGIVHGSRNIRSLFSSNKTGRHRRELPEDYTEIIRRYLYGEIGRKQCQNELGLGEHSKLTDTWFFKKYLSEKGIESYKNKVDLFSCAKNKTIFSATSTRVIAEIHFKDGKSYTRLENGHTEYKR